MLDRLARLAHQSSGRGDFVASQEMFRTVGLKGTAFEQLMAELGYAALKSGDGEIKFRAKAKKRRHVPKRLAATRRHDPNSPFAQLRDLTNAE